MLANIIGCYFESMGLTFFEESGIFNKKYFLGGFVVNSFTDVHGDVVPFESKHELTLELQTDIVTGSVTAYLVWHNDHLYTVDKKVYEAIENM